MFDTTTGNEANTADNVNDDVDVHETDTVDTDTDEGDVETDDDSDDDVGDDSDDSEEAKPKAKKEAEEKPFRAWDFSFDDDDEQVQERNTREQHVPYDRFAKVNTRVHELEAELASLRGTTQSQAQPVTEQTLEDLYNSYPVPEDYADGKSFTAALANHQRTIYNAQQELIAQRTAHQANIDNIKRHSYETASQFLERATGAAKSNPEVANAIDVFTRISSKLHPDILHAIMSDEAGPDLVHRITTNKDVFATIINSRRDFVGAARALERMSIQAQQANNNKKNAAANKTNTATTATATKSVPRVIRTGDTSAGPRTLRDLTPKQIEKLSDKEYARLRART